MSAHFTAIGAVSGATLGWFDPQRKMYKKIPIDGQHEVIGMIGDIALYQGKHAVHTRMVVGGPDGTTRAGHVLATYASPTVNRTTCCGIMSALRSYSTARFSIQPGSTGFPRDRRERPFLECRQRIGSAFYQAQLDFNSTSGANRGRLTMPTEVTTTSPSEADITKLLLELEVPFSPDQVQWRVTNTSNDKKRGQVVPYADPRAYTDRLNALFSPKGWTREYKVETMSDITRIKKGEQHHLREGAGHMHGHDLRSWSHSGRTKSGQTMTMA